MQSVVIIGGGLSGSLLALELLRDRDAGRRVILIDRTGAFGRGVAYATADAQHLLNVPAARMSAYADRPTHFLRWLARRHNSITAVDYVPRGIYGDYIWALLDAAIADGAALELVVGEVVDVEPEGLGGRVHFGDGSSIGSDQVVLATGSPAGPPPFWLPTDPRIFENAWSPDALRPHPAGHHTLLVGSGLTAIDVALATTRLGAQVTMVSRHGLLPAEHLPGPRNPVAPALLPVSGRGEASLEIVERFVTAHIDSVRAAGGDWRDAFDGLRPHTPHLWAMLTPGAQREFLTSRARRWDVSRHRMPAETAARIRALRADAQLRVLAGSFGAVRARTAGLEIELDGRVLHAQRLVCCTGAGRDVRSDPLVARLAGSGLVVCDDLSLGLRADEDGAVLDSAGRPRAWLRTLGPLRRGELWETTAAEEIRAQAGVLARVISGSRLAAAA